MKRQAAVLTGLRTAAAREVEKQMAARLVPLGMPNVRFQVEIGTRKEPGAQGADTVNFLFSANKNGALQNISSVASGGRDSPCHAVCQGNDSRSGEAAHYRVR